MGLVMGLTAARDANIRRFLADPPLVLRLLAPDDPELYEESRAEHGPRTGDELDLEEGEGEALYLDKSWHGIHYLLTGSAWEGAPPLNILVSGGEPVGDPDAGDGQTRALTAQQVADASRALAALTDRSIRERFDPAAMMQADIYPAIWDRPPDQDDTLGYLMEYLAQLRDYLSRVAGAGLGVIVSVG